MTDRIGLAAGALDQAARDARAMPQFTGADALALDEAYDVQRALVQHRIDRGARRVGMKMGFTSRAKMVQMGISDMIWGRLTSDMMVEDGAAIDHGRFVHPRAEPEIAFLIGKRLAGPVTPLQALEAVAGVAPAIEIIDSRYEDFKFSLADVVADNSSSSGFVVGPWSAPAVDTANLGMLFTVDGRPAGMVSSAALLGHPLRSLAAASRLAEAAGEVLDPGSIVLAGGAAAAIALRPGTVVGLEVEALGRVGFSVAGGQA